MKYTIEIEHHNDGRDDYNEELFEKSLPYLLKVVYILKSMNMFPKIGEILYANGAEDDDIWEPGEAPETGYIITYIVYYEDSLKICVNDKY